MRWFVPLVIFVSGGGFVLGAGWLLRRLLRDRPDPALMILPPKQLFRSTDEAVRLTTEARRRQAQAVRKDAARLESGDTGSKLSLLKRRA